MTWAHLLPELHTALESWPAEDPTGRRAAIELRDHIARRVRDLLEERGPSATAELLGIGRVTLLRWRQPGGPMESVHLPELAAAREP